MWMPATRDIDDVAAAGKPGAEAAGPIDCSIALPRQAAALHESSLKIRAASILFISPFAAFHSRKLLMLRTD